MVYYTESLFTILSSAPYNPFLSEEMLRVFRCCTAISMASAPMNFTLSSSRQTLRARTRLATTIESNHPHPLRIPNLRRNFHENTFFPCTAHLWKSLPFECFPQMGMTSNPSNQKPTNIYQITNHLIYLYIISPTSFHHLSIILNP